jgi:photosystem II stability/assembly factor-like uncharacterized protein
LTNALVFSDRDRGRSVDVGIGQASGARKPPRHRLAAASLHFVLAACGAEPALSPAAPTPSVAPPIEASVAPSSAFWTLRHAATATTATIDLGDGRLEVDPSGERWIVAGQRITAAATFLPERVTHAVRVGEAIVFVTDASTAYPVSASDPLGPIGDPARPPRALAHVSTGKSSILGIDGREVIRSVDGGHAWSPVALDGAPPRIPGSIAMSPDGTGAIVTFPQRSFATTDDGASWTHVAPPPGGLEDVRTEAGHVVAYSGEQRAAQLRTEPLRWDTKMDPSSPGGLVQPEPALQYRDGAFAGLRWLEVVTTPTGSGDTQEVLWEEDLTQQRLARRLASLPMCRPGATVGASPNGQIVVVACTTSTPGEVIVLRSIDGGGTMRRDGAFRSRGAPAQVAVATDGTTAFLGVTASLDDRAPLDGAIGSAGNYAGITATDGAAKVAVTLVAFAASTVVALGTEEGGDAVVALVSHDAGHSWQVTQRFADGSSVASLSAEGDEVVAQLWSGPLLLSSDGGITWRSQQPPDAIAMAMVGRHGLAVSSGGLIETDDGARTWSPVARPMLSTEPALRCGLQACIVTEWARRIGWGATSAQAPSPTASPAPTTTAAPIAPAAIRCRASGEAHHGYAAAWTPFLAARDGLRWSHVVFDRVSGGPRLSPPEGVGLVEQVMTARGPRRDVRPLLKLTGERLQLDTRLTTEGVAVVDYPGADYLESIVYTGKGPVRAAWVSNHDPGTVKRVSFDPRADGVTGGGVQTRALDDGSLLVSFSGSAKNFVLGTKGVKRSFVADAWNVVHVGARALSVANNLLLRDIDAPDTFAAWTLDDKDSGDWAAICLGGCGPELDATHGIAAIGGRLIAWTTRPDAVLLAPVEVGEAEPTSVAVADVSRVLDRPVALRACTASSRHGVRVVVAPPPGLRVAIEAEGDAPLELDVKRVVLDAALDGSSCVRALFAAEHGDTLAGFTAAIFPDDLPHATLFHSFTRDDYDQPLACAWGH